MTNDDARNAEIKGVCLWLTRSEAQELIDSLSNSLTIGPAQPVTHHVSSADYQREVTVTLTDD